MNAQQLQIEQQPPERFIVTETEEGFRVISPLEPAKQYIVSGTPEEPACTCPDFHHRTDQTWQCVHIAAVFQVRPTEPAEASAAPATTPQNGEPEAKKPRSAGKAEMFLKRSISPDGRIDSLSVEFSMSVEKKSVDEIRAQADTTLKLQSQIIESFLTTAKKQTPAPASPPRFQKNGASTAQLLRIEGMPGKWGRRLFITVALDGKTLRFFGSAKELAEALTAAGYECTQKDIQEGAELNLPCQVVTRPTEDGKYLNVEKLLPLARSLAGGRA